MRKAVCLMSADLSTMQGLFPPSSNTTGVKFSAAAAKTFFPTEVLPVKNILFASEMIGAVRGIDPQTGFYFDDTKRYIASQTQLSSADRQQIYEGNARHVFPLLDQLLKIQSR